MSSLIEQAPKRLEELRRAGVETPEGATAPGETQPASLSTPEAMILALEARGHSQALAPRPREERREAPVRREPRPPAEPDPSRRIEIDFARLKARGFVTPNDGSSQIADEFRVIKRPIIRNALGASAVRNGNLVMVTSALPGEGKTFTSLNLALSIATEIDSTVLLVDGDVAHPSIPEILAAPHGPGLLDLLTRDDLDFADALLKTNGDKLSLLPAGSRHRWRSRRNISTSTRSSRPTWRGRSTPRDGRSWSRISRTARCAARSSRTCACLVEDRQSCLSSPDRQDCLSSTWPSPPRRSSRFSRST
jgi:Mrp family chromosome partitioning ATPase